MSKQPITPTNMITKNLFMVTFSNGETYYGISKLKTPASFIKANIKFAKFHLENPQIHSVVYFEELLLNNTEYNCVILMSGNLEELAVIKDKLVTEDKMCMNSKKTLVGIKKLEKSNPVKIKREYVKTLRGIEGTILTYIEKNFGLSRGLDGRMKFNDVHPLKPTFCLITSSIEIV